MYAVVLDFGYTDDAQIEQSSINDLRKSVISNFTMDSTLIILAQSATYQALKRMDLIPDTKLLEIRVAQSGEENGGGLQDGGTYFVLREAYRMILDDNKVQAPLEGQPFCCEVGLIAHRHHVPRAILQGRLFGLKLIPMQKLPYKMYRQAKQWWCRNYLLWCLHEAVGWPLLWLHGQL